MADQNEANLETGSALDHPYCEQAAGGGETRQLWTLSLEAPFSKRLPSYSMAWGKV